MKRRVLQRIIRDNESQHPGHFFENFCLGAEILELKVQRATITGHSPLPLNGQVMQFHHYLGTCMKCIL